MKYAEIITKDCITGEMKNEGEAMLLNCMDKCQDNSFWEIKFVADMSKTQCRWIENSKIFER